MLKDCSVHVDIALYFSIIMTHAEVTWDQSDLILTQDQLINNITNLSKLSSWKKLMMKDRVVKAELALCLVLFWGMPILHRTEVTRNLWTAYSQYHKLKLTN